MEIKYETLDELWDFLLQIKSPDGINIIRGKIENTTNGEFVTESVSFDAYIEKQSKEENSGK